MQNTYIKFLSVISIARIHTVSNAVLGRAERVNGGDTRNLTVLSAAVCMAAQLAQETCASFFGS